MEPFPDSRLVSTAGVPLKQIEVSTRHETGADTGLLKAKSQPAEIEMTGVSKRNLVVVGVGLFCPAVAGLVVGAMRPDHVSGAVPGAPTDVEVVQVEQK